MNSTEYQVQQLQLWVKELETRLLQLEDRVVFNPPTRPEPAFNGFMDKENCRVNLCFTPHAPGGPNNTYATAYYTSPPAQRKPLPEDQLLGIWNKAITQDNGRGSHLSNQPFVHIARAIEAAHGIKENT